MITESFLDCGVLVTSLPKEQGHLKIEKKIMSNYNETKWPDLFEIVKIQESAWMEVDGQI